MDCKKTTGLLIDLLDGSLDEARAEQVRHHVESCRICREELELLQRGHGALVHSINALAPAGKYLTRQRYERLLARGKVRSLAPRALLVRRFAAAALVAVILVCGFYLTNDIVGFYRPVGGVGGPQMDLALRGEPGVRGDLQPVTFMLVPAPQDGPMQAVVGYMRPEAAPGWSAQPAQASSMRVVRNTAPGVQVPVWNEFYDAEEAGYWW